MGNYISEWSRMFLEGEYREAVSRIRMIEDILCKTEKELCSFPFKVHTTKDGVMWRQNNGEWIYLYNMDNAHLNNSVKLVKSRVKILEEKKCNHSSIIYELVREQMRRKRAEKAKATKGTK